MIEVIELSKNYGDKEALKNISFSLRGGEIVGLIGKNGAGKSTILKSLAGILQYDSGKILYNGVDCSQKPSVIQDFGILIDCAFLDYISAYDNLKLLYQLDPRRSAKDIDSEINNVFELVGLSEVKNKFVKTFSFGMKQRLGLAQAIINAHSVIMLDEPFIGLDPIGKEIVKKAIVKKAKDEGYAVLFSSHDLEDVAEICDRIVMIENGICTYNDKLKSQTEYRFYFSDSNWKNSVGDLQTSVSELHIFETGFSFIDDIDNPHINDVLCTVAFHSKISKVEASNNMLKNMFSEEN